MWFQLLKIFGRQGLKFLVETLGAEVLRRLATLLVKKESDKAAKDK